jgi:cystathionine gamma-synthase
MSSAQHFKAEPRAEPRDETRAETRAVRCGLESDTQHGAVVPPLHLSSNFTFAGFDQKREYDYTRSGNPTRDVLGRALADLERGAGAVVTSSGMSAITLVLQLLAPGDLLIAPHDCYGGTYRLVTTLAARGRFDLELVDQTDPEALAAVMRRGPKMIWVETPSNPLLRVTDIAAVVAAARPCGALVVVDNTFLSPVYQRPLALGADVVVHSTTKYLNGHSDVVGGCAVAGSPELHQQLSWWGNCLGLTGAPFDSFLTLRGLRTLHARMRVHEENVAAVVELLQGHPAVPRVFYPGLLDHPSHELACRQQLGFGCMLSFELQPGDGVVEAFLEGLHHFSLAESLGGVESLVAHPATMTHAAMDPAARAVAGISDQLLRLSVGIEAAVDLVADLQSGLERALRCAFRPQGST